MIQDMINSENSMNTTESTNTHIFKIIKNFPILYILIYEPISQIKKICRIRFQAFEACQNNQRD